MWDSTKLAPKTRLRMILALVGRRHPAGRIQGHDRSQAVGHGTDPANPLGEVLGIDRMSVLENIFKPAKQGAGGLGVDDLLHAVLCFHGDFDLEMPFQP